LKKTEDALPNAAKFMREVLRGSDYSFESAIADVVDNSIEASAKNVSIWVDYDNLELLVIDDGKGMSDSVHKESMKIASETRSYSTSDLGKYGTGMKAASLSQARRLTVGTIAQGASKVSVRCLDMDHIEATNDWAKLTLIKDADSLPERAREFFKSSQGTVIVWQLLDRVFADGRMDSSAASKELKDQTRIAENHLAMVFHRFLVGRTKSKKKVTISINGNKIKAWDPFVLDEKTVKFSEVPVSVNGSTVLFTGYVLPSEKEFSSKQAFAAASGPKKWNDSQGFYVYRNDRLIRWGGWLKTRASDEHTKLARISLDFTSELDAVFQVNVAKSGVTLPLAVKTMFAEQIKDLAAAAQKRYRSKVVPQGTAGLPGKKAVVATVERQVSAAALATLLDGVAKQEGMTAELNKLKTALRKEEPSISKKVGW
jgi:hypothetical protein